MIFFCCDRFGSVAPGYEMSCEESRSSSARSGVMVFSSDEQTFGGRFLPHAYTWVRERFDICGINVLVWVLQRTSTVLSTSSTIPEGRDAAPLNEIIRSHYDAVHFWSALETCAFFGSPARFGQLAAWFPRGLLSPIDLINSVRNSLAELIENADDDGSHRGRYDSTTSSSSGNKRSRSSTSGLIPDRVQRESYERILNDDHLEVERHTEFVLSCLQQLLDERLGESTLGQYLQYVLLPYDQRTVLANRGYEENRSIALPQRSDKWYLNWFCANTLQERSESQQGSVLDEEMPQEITENHVWEEIKRVRQEYDFASEPYIILRLHSNFFTSADHCLGFSLGLAVHGFYVVLRPQYCNAEYLGYFMQKVNANFRRIMPRGRESRFFLIPMISLIEKLKDASANLFELADRADHNQKLCVAKPKTAFSLHPDASPASSARQRR